MISAKFAHDFEKLSRTRVLLINKVDAHGVAPFNMRLRPVSIERSKKKRALPCTYEIHAHREEGCGDVANGVCVPHLFKFHNLSGANKDGQESKEFNSTKRTTPKGYSLETKW